MPTSLLVLVLGLSWPHTGAGQAVNVYVAAAQDTENTVSLESSNPSESYGYSTSFPG